MSIDLKEALQTKAINGWGLFSLVAIPMSVVMVVKLMGTDLSTAPGVSEMIGFSVRIAVPIIFLVVGISALQKLFPGPIPMWLLRNRPYIGFCFAVAMAWQGLFIFMISNFYRDYYFEKIYYLRDELEGSTGYIFLTVMVLTSFQFARKHLNPKQWRMLHISSLYFLFAYPFSVYWWNLSYYENPQPMDYVYYLGGFLAFSLRIAAWGQKRHQGALKNGLESATPIAYKLLGAGTVAFGLFAAATGRLWQYPVTTFLTGPGWSANLELWLPFWPFEPFLPLFIIGLGVMLATNTRLSVSEKELAARISN